MVLSEYLMISIHTTTQVVTLVRAVLTEVDGISIHTTTQVVTYISFPPRLQVSISIHTTTQVVTRGTDGLQAPGQFQSTPPRRW